MMTTMKTTMWTVLLCLICVLCCSVATPVKADTEFPYLTSPNSTEVTLPPMPWFWPIVLPTEEPTTPVPPVPSPEMIYLSNLARVLQIGEELDGIDTDIRLAQFLLDIDPNGANAPMLQMQIQMLQMQKATLEAERESLRKSMIGSL